MNFKYSIICAGLFLITSYANGENTDGINDIHVYFIDIEKHQARSYTCQDLLSFADCNAHASDHREAYVSSYMTCANKYPRTAEKLLLKAVFQQQEQHASKVMNELFYKGDLSSGFIRAMTEALKYQWLYHKQLRTTFAEADLHSSAASQIITNHKDCDELATFLQQHNTELVEPLHSSCVAYHNMIQELLKAIDEPA